MSAHLAGCLVLLLALAGCVGGADDARRFNGAYGGLSGGTAVRGTP